MEAEMSKAKAFSILAVLILALGACKPQPVVSSALSELQGVVDIRPSGEGDFTPATTESVLGVDGQIQTGDDGRVRLDLSSGTIVRVAPSSLFTLAANEQVEGGLATRIKLELGEVFIILNGGSAEVETPSGVASVRGSYLQVGVDPVTGDVIVTCLEGDCSAGNGAGTVNFTDGQKVILYFSDTGEWALPQVEDMTPEEIQYWLDNNPEALDIINQLFSQQNPTEPPPPPPAPPPGDDGNGGGNGNGGDTCFNLIEPPAGAELPLQGPVNFTWEPQPGASYFVVSFTDSSGKVITFQTSETELSKYIEILPDAGEYNWQVTAYGADGAEICTAAAASFSKPDSNPEGSKRDNTGCDPTDCSGKCPDSEFCPLNGY
jgi:hypothetical protein